MTFKFIFFLLALLPDGTVSRDRVEAFMNAREADIGDQEVDREMDKFNNQKGIATTEKLPANGKLKRL